MNFGFNFDTDYDQNTSKHIPLNSFDLNDTDDGDDFTKHELKQLLARLEADLQTKEDEIAILKNERNKMLLYDAKYGKLCVNDPFLALRRDSTVTEEILDERCIGQLYESQLLQLEKLISVQKKTHNKSKSLLSATEKRHTKALRELELEKEIKSRYADKGDDVLALLEKERNKLTQQLEFQIGLVATAQEERGRLERRLEADKEKHKSMVLFLINERKQLLVKIHELRLQSENQPSAPAAQEALVDDMRREIKFLRQERDILINNKKSFQAEILSLKEVVKGQEGELMLLKRNMMSGASIKTDKTAALLPQLTDDRGGIVVANRMAGGIPMNSAVPPRTRLSTSSSFPSERSRLPRAPSSPARTPISLASRTPTSPTKKIPAMGLGTVRRNPLPSLEPELEQLEAAIKSMDLEGANVAPTSPTKRSSSLPRGRTEPQRTEPVLAAKTEPRPIPPQMGSRIVPPTRPDLPVRKPPSSTSNSSTVKRNGFSSIGRAFGGK